jgi:guanylate kinase
MHMRLGWTNVVRPRSDRFLFIFLSPDSQYQVKQIRKTLVDVQHIETRLANASSKCMHDAQADICGSRHKGEFC